MVRASVALLFTLNSQPSTIILRRPHEMQLAIATFHGAKDLAMDGARCRKRNERRGHVSNKLLDGRTVSPDDALRRRVDDEQVDTPCRTGDPGGVSPRTLRIE